MSRNICELCDGPLYPWCKDAECLDTLFPKIKIKTFNNTYCTNGSDVFIIKDCINIRSRKKFNRMPIITSYRNSVYLQKNFTEIFSKLSQYLYKDLVWIILNYILIEINDIDLTEGMME
jgi:hypothetical protein